jgi:hypothetical protein
MVSCRFRNDLVWFIGSGEVESLMLAATMDDEEGEWLSEATVSPSVTMAGSEQDCGRKEGGNAGEEEDGGEGAGEGEVESCWVEFRFMPTTVFRTRSSYKPG